MSRISATFAKLRRADRAAFVPFVTAGDPDPRTSFAILERLPSAGADLIELGVPFSDPMADGRAIQAANVRALNGGMTLAGVLDLVRRFRSKDNETPIVLMGYFNPIHAYGVSRFAAAAASAGVDGVITVDLPPEEDEVLRIPASANGLDTVRLVTPTTGGERLAAILNGASGFLYYVSVAGVTGTKTYAETDVRKAIVRIRTRTGIPCAAGFGIKTPDRAAAIARFADGAVVGSAIVDRIAHAAAAGKPGGEIVAGVTGFCKEIAEAVHGTRAAAAIG